MQTTTQVEKIFEDGQDEDNIAFVSGRSLILAQTAQSVQSDQFYFLIADLN